MSPSRAPTPCTVPRCPNMATTRGRCALHATATETRRGSSATRGYGTRWRSIRREFLRDNPTCMDCGGASEVPDHSPRSRRQLVADPTVEDPDDPIWLEPVCAHCHNARTRRRGW